VRLSKHGMSTTLVAYVNNDDALLLWTVDDVDAGCLGFGLQRKLRRGNAAVDTSWLDNFARPGPEPHQLGLHRPSDRFPFRSFTWTDHSVVAGDKVRYRAVPVVGGNQGPEPDLRLASDWTNVLEIGGRANAKYQAFFNRGFVISQFMSRYLDQHYPGLTRIQALRQFKADISAQVENTLRTFLSGELRKKLLEVLDVAADANEEVYAALFELGDTELLQRLTKFRERAHIVLANGSIERKKPETAAQARKRDENKDARRQLLDATADVQTTSRFVSPGALAHNKFLVLTDDKGKPNRVWTGSTNWTTTGLCTQLNNALLVHDKQVAEAYLAQWHALREAASSHPASLATSNDEPSGVGGKASVHFTRAKGRVDLAALRDVVRGAKEGVLFLMFIPGASGVLGDVRALADEKPDLLVRGVVSELPKGRTDEKTGTTTAVRVTLYGTPTSAQAGPRTYDVVQPEGKAHPTAYWAAETTRGQFLNSIGHAIIHSKVLVVDPFGKDPVVVTGSHNFSISASEKNDENFIIVRGDRALAEAYAVNVESAWRHYAARAGNPHAQLFGLDYLRALLADQRREEHFWRLT
jgi:phosphatidylserine/phosphatidylglycerophosphate/cardiolipin synthase-like enzyme